VIDASVFDYVKRACAQLCGWRSRCWHPQLPYGSRRTPAIPRRRQCAAAQAGQEVPDRITKVRVVWAEDDVGAYDDVRRLSLGKVS